MFKRYLLGVLAVFSIAFFPGIIGIKIDDVKAATLNVGADDGFYDSISEAITAASSGDTILVKSTYVSSTEFFPINFGAKTNVTLDCQNSGATIQSSATSTLVLTEGSALQNCNLADVAIEGQVHDSVTVTGNIVRLNTNIAAAAFFSGVGSNLTVSGNTVDVYYGSEGEYDYPLINIATGSNNTISNNVFRYNVAGDETLRGAIKAQGANLTITGNYIKFPSSMSDCNQDLIMVQGASSANINHNTFHFSGCNPNSHVVGAIRVSDSVEGGTINVTSTYNIFYASYSGVVNGIYSNKEFTSSTINIYEDYNGNYQLDNLITSQGSDSDNDSIVSGGHNYSNDPFFKTNDASSANDLQLAPYSQYLDVNGTNDIGAYSAARATTFNIDDNGTVDYSTVHSTSTSWLSSGLRTGDTVNFLAGNYNGFNIVSSSVLTGNLTLNGHEPNNVYTINLKPFTYNTNSYSNISGSSDPGIYLADGTNPETDLHTVTVSGTDISAYVSSTPQDWHLGLVSTSTNEGDYYFTVYHSDIVFPNESDAQTFWDGLGYQMDYWATSTFSYNGSEYTYTAPNSPTTSGDPVISIDNSLDTIINVSSATNGIALTGLNNNTINNLVIRNASSTSNTYTITEHPFDYNGHTYNNLMSGNGIYLAYDNNTSNLVSVTSPDLDITNYVSSTPQNWHLGLVSGGGSYYTIYHRGDYFTSESVASSTWGGLGLTVDLWATSTFEYSGGTYVYNAPTGPTVNTSYQTGTPNITKTTNYFSGIKFTNSNTNTVSNSTLSNNRYGVWFTGSSSGNVVSSTSISGSVTYDVYHQGTADNRFNNVTFTRTSSTIESTGDVDVYYKTRAYVTNVSSTALSGVSVNFVDAGNNATTTLTTGSDGYTSYSDYLMAYKMDSSSVALTNGGYNPYTVSAVATSTYDATSTSSNLSSANQLFTLAMAVAEVSVPDAPTGLTATADSTSQISLSWTAVSGATSYKIYRDNYVTAIATSSANSYVNTGLSSGTSYSYKVSAVNGAGESALSSIASATTRSSGGGGRTYYPPVVITTSTPTSTTATSTTSTVPVATTTSTPTSTISSETNNSVITPVIVKALKFTKTLKLGMTDNEVSELQKVLKELKYFKYPSITNYFGSVTKAALLAYQKANKLSATGITDKATRDMLNGEEMTGESIVVESGTYKFTKFLYIGSTGTEVKQLQLKLKELGYYNGPISSYFGSLTKAAVIKLQKENKLTPAMGWTGPGTRAILNK